MWGAHGLVSQTLCFDLREAINLGYKIARSEHLVAHFSVLLILGGRAIGARLEKTDEPGWGSGSVWRCESGLTLQYPTPYL